jgi:hypothetical protein
MPPQRSLQPAVRRLAISLPALASATLLLTTCAEEPMAPARPGLGGIAVQAELEGSLLAGLAIDNIHLVVTRISGQRVLDKTYPFAPSQSRLTISEPILLNERTEDFDVLLEYRAQTLVLFSGTQRLTVQQGPPPSTPAAIPVTYALPDAASIMIAPRDSVLTFGDALTFRVTAFDAQQQPMTQFYVSWSTTAPQLAQPIDATGRLVAVNQRQVVQVKAVTPTGVADSTTLTLVPRPTQLLKVAGDQQIAPAGTRLAALLEVEVRAADNLPVAGVPVSFAVLSGGGSVDSSSVPTDLQGRAATGAVLGAIPGLQQFAATVTGVGTVTFDATATTVSPGALTWTGAVSSDWNNTGNWSPARVPTSADDVIIPAGTPASPQVTVSCSARSLTVNAGAALSLNGFNCQVGGNVFADGSIVGPGAIQIATTALIRGALPDLILSGPVTAASSVVAQAVTVTGASGQLIAGGQNVDILGNLTVQSGARLVMTNAADRVQVFGNALFAGGDASTSLTAGSLGVIGNFTQSNGSGTPNSFVATGTHLTALNGNFGQTVSFQNPGQTASRFQNLQIFGSALSSPRTVTLATRVEILGQLAVAGPRLVVATSANPAPSAALTARGGLVLADAVFDNTTIALDAPSGTAPLSLARLTFTNMDPTVPQVAINHSGTGGPFTFSTLTFATVPTTGFYLAATDADGPTPTPLTIDVTASSPTSGAPFVQVTNGAVVNWPPVSPGPRTWAGTVSSDWNDPNNWTPVGVPLATDDVSIPVSAPNGPTLASNATVHDLTVAPSAQLLLQPGVTLTVTGDLVSSADDQGGGVVGGTVVLTGGLASGNVDSLRILGPVTVSTTLTATNLVIGGTFGNLDVNGQSVVVMGDLATVAGGTLQMNQPGSVSVGRDATFAGGPETGLLTEGVLGIGRNFAQAGTGMGGAASFEASGNHLTFMLGTKGGIAFATPGLGPSQSRFQHLSIACLGDTVTFNSPAFIGGDFQVGAACTAVLGGKVQANGNVAVLANGRLQINGQRLDVLGNVLTSQQGTIAMQSPSDTLSTGGALWDGGDETGLLTDGVLQITGDFTQGPTTTFPTSFAPSGNHLTRFLGGGAHTVIFKDSGPLASHFHHLKLEGGSGPITLAGATSFFVTGTLTANTLDTLVGNGASLETQGNWDIINLKLDRVLMRLVQGTPAAPKFDFVSFLNYQPSDVQLHVEGPGGPAGGPPRRLFFGSLQFTPLQRSDPGLYVRLVSSNGLGLELQLPGSNQSPGVGGNGPGLSDPPNQQTVNGATIIWP